MSAGREQPRNARQGWGSLGADGRERATKLLRENTGRNGSPGPGVVRTKADRRLAAIRSMLANR
jgi:hypothetical protein